MARKTFERNDLGNVVTPDFPYDPNEFRYWQYTYIFKYYDENYGDFLPCFQIQEFDRESVTSARKDFDFIEVELGDMPLELIFRNELIYNRNFQSALLFEHFKTVFEVGRNFHDADKYGRVFMKKTHYHEIMNFLNDHELLYVRDFFLQLIIRCQDEFLKHSFHLNKKAVEKQINNLHKDVVKLEKAIDKLDNSRPLSIQINFTDETIKLTDDLITRSILDDYKKYLNQLPLHNWRKSLNRFKNVYDEDLQHVNFKERYCKALHSFLLKSPLFPKTTTKTPNKVLYFIDQLLIFSGIYAGGTDEIPSVRIKHIRNYIGRSTLREPIITLDLPADKELLYKYFEREFVDMAVGNVRGKEVLEVAGWVFYRFGLEKRVNEIAHIAQCLWDFLYIICDQVSSGSLVNFSFKEFDEYSNLVDHIKKGGNIKAINFDLDGKTESCSFHSRMPLHIIAQALQVYYKEHKEEVENDLLEGRVRRTGQTTLQMDFKPAFQLPENRFIVEFVNCMYNFLLNEFPPGDKEMFPSENYYLIVAVLLQRIGYFRSLPPLDEQQAVLQVKAWHKLSRNSPI